MLRKYFSVWMLYVRSTIVPLIGTLVLMAAVQTGSFLWAMQYSACSLENIVLAAYLQQSLLGGILLLTVLLCRIHGGGYTLRRLRISKRAVFLWHGFTNFSCFVLLWIAEVCIITVLCSHFLTQSATHLSNQTLFLGFYRSEFLHSILPLEEVSRWIYLLITFLYEKLTISLEKDSDGRIYSSGANADEGEQFNFYTQSIVTPETVYFSFYNRTNQNHIVDTSLIPGGYGIYAMDYRAGKVQQQGNSTQTVENGTLQLDSLRLAYPIDPKEEFLDLKQWSNGKDLLLFTKKENDYFLTVIAMDSMQQLQKVKIQTAQNAQLVNHALLKHQNFLVSVIDKTVTVLLPNDDGTFYVAMQTPNTLEYQQIPFINSGCMDFQNGKLALIYPADSSHVEARDHTSFDVVILDQNGMQLWARYHSSLQNDLSDSYNTDDIVHLSYNHPVDVTW